MEGVQVALADAVVRRAIEGENNDIAPNAARACEAKMYLSSRVVIPVKVRVVRSP